MSRSKRETVVNLKIIKIFILSFLSAYFFIDAPASRAAEICLPATVTVIIRDQSGAFIPGINFQIIKQITNIDNEPRPGAVVASGLIDSITGRSVLTIPVNPAENNLYLLKIYDKNQTIGAFHYYNELTLGCGEEKEINKTLSGLAVELRDTNGDLRKNTSYAIYRQTYDANGQKIKEASQIVANLNSGLTGRNTIYLAGDQATLDQAPISYVFASPGFGGKEFVYWDITMVDGQVKMFNYIFSDLKIRFEDQHDKNLPAGTAVEFLSQKSDSSGRVVADQLITQLLIDAYGYINFEYPAGTYFLRIRKTNGEYYNFTDVVLRDRARTSRTFEVKDDTEQKVACSASSVLTVTPRDSAGNFISGIKFELYEKTLNANNLPAAGTMVTSGVSNNLGNASATFTPLQNKAYILKLYDKNAALGAFWYYDDIIFTCDEDKTITKKLSSLNLTVRDINNSILKNTNVSLYLQKKDIDNNIIKSPANLVANLLTDDSGQTVAYLSGGNPAQYQDIARYFISLNYGGLIFEKEDIGLAAESVTQINYSLSGLALNAADAAGNKLKKAVIEVYEQKIDTDKNKVIGKLITSLTLDDNGIGAAAVPAGVYAVGVKDSANNLLKIWDVKIENGILKKLSLTVPVLRVYATGANGENLSSQPVNIYALIKDADGWFIKDRNVYNTTIAAGMKYVDLILAYGQYLIAINQGTATYGAAIDVNNNGLKKVYLSVNEQNLVKPESRYRLATVKTVPEAAAGSLLAEKLKGYVLLQVEARGEAWYVNTSDKKRYYLRDGSASYDIMRNSGLGIKNSELRKIPIGILPSGGEADCDSDGLPDALEQAYGTEACDQDSDGDGYNDGQELMNNYNPLGLGKLSLDAKLTNRLSGKILLQVEANGEAWYLNPRDKKRYYLKDGQAAYTIMKFLSLGVKNSDLNAIDQAE